MNERSVLRRSHATQRALTSPRPRLRGRSHLLAALVALPVAVAWIVLAPSGAPRAAIAAFTLGVAAMFSGSALLHLRPWDARVHERLLRLDHTGIYLAIVGTGIAVGLLGFEGWPRVVLLSAIAGGGLAGVVVEWLPFAAPSGLNHAIYLTLGWTPIVLLPWLWSTSGPLVVGLLAGGGVLYTVGAILVGARWPGVSARWFGFHELFHVLVIAAVITHAVMVATLVRVA